jgi:2-keto-4-pentenoate hydratase/2-oxohepta-3-ene-1,7-dioic acid hydratase in catechol pathway
VSTRYARVTTSSGPRYAELLAQELLLLDAAPWAGGKRTGESMPLDPAWLLAPTEASKVVAMARSYREHAAELGNAVPQEPLFFLKPSTAINAHGQPIVLPPQSTLVHHEAEAAVVIGRRLHRASAEEAQAAIFAVTCFNDVTARDLQRKDSHFTRAKGFDTFACIGPWMVSGLDCSRLKVQGRVNGQVRQDGSTAELVFPIPVMLAFVSQVMTLLPGDVVATGTPPGVGPLIDGDRVEVEVEGVGVLSNPVKKFEPSR